MRSAGSPPTLFAEIKVIMPDPRQDGNILHLEELKFEDSERHMPSFAKKIPVWVSGKFLKKERAHEIVICNACMKPRIISKSKKTQKVTGLSPMMTRKLRKNR